MKKWIITLILFAFLFNSITPQETGNRWIGMYNPPANAASVIQLKKSGINTVFLKPNLSHVLFFKKHGFSVLVSFPVFFDIRMMEAHPELHAIDKNGHRLPKIAWYRGITPTVQWFKDMQLRKIQYILRQFPADGLFLDFIRFPLHWESKNPSLIDSSFSPEALKMFETHTNLKIPLSLKNIPNKAKWIYENHAQKWSSFKCGIITDFIKKVKELITEIKPSLKLGAFVIPWKNKDFNGAIRSIAGQDIDKIKEIVDYISPMVYHKALGNNELWLTDIITYFKNKTGGKVFPIIQSFSIKDGEFLNSLRVVNTYPGLKGFAVFGYTHMTANKFNVFSRYIMGR